MMTPLAEMLARSMTAGLARKTLLKALRDALEHLPALPEWVDTETREVRGWPTTADALKAMHLPESVADLAPEAAARRRLAFDELLASQLAIADRPRGPTREISRGEVVS